MIGVLWQAQPPPGAAIPRAPRSAVEIIADVAARRGVTVSEIRSADRTRRVAHARQEAMYELRRRTKLSTPQIAQRLGLKDHTTVLHGLRAHEARMAAPQGAA